METATKAIRDKKNFLIIGAKIAKKP